MPDIPLVQAADKEQLQIELKKLAEQILASVSVFESAQSKELISDFVSDLFLGVANQSQQEARRRKQAEGIAAAQASGIRFGRPRKALPENFDEQHCAWRDGEISLDRAAEACGMTKSAFYNAAVRREQRASAG